MKVAGTKLFCREAAQEISQLRSGWWEPGKKFPSRRDGGKIVAFRRPFGTSDLPGGIPDTSCLANFPLSLRDERCVGLAVQAA